MAKTVTKTDVTPFYMEAAKRLLQMVDAKTDGLKGMSDVRERLIKSAKKPVLKQFEVFDVVCENKAIRFIFHAQGEVTLMGQNGNRAYLFVGEEGAGFVRYAATDSNVVPAHVFYCDTRGEVERNHLKYNIRVDGEKVNYDAVHDDHPDLPDGIMGVFKEFLLDANAALEERVKQLDRDYTPAALASALTGG